MTGSDVAGGLRPMLFSAKILKMNSLSLRFSIQYVSIEASNVAIFVHLAPFPIKGRFSITYPRK